MPYTHGAVKKLSSLDCALTTANVAYLEQIVREHKQSKSSYAVCGDGIDESKVMKEYKDATMLRPSKVSLYVL